MHYTILHSIDTLFLFIWFPSSSSFNSLPSNTEIVPDEARQNKYEGITPMEPHYYGFLDEEDGVLMKYEQAIYEQGKNKQTNI